jgi:hypothetical protein
MLQLDRVIAEGTLTKRVNQTQRGMTDQDQSIRQAELSGDYYPPQHVNWRSPTKEQSCVCESDLVSELEIIQEMQEKGAIRKNNALILQSQKIYELRILRASKS